MKDSSLGNGRLHVRTVDPLFKALLPSSRLSLLFFASMIAMHLYIMCTSSYNVFTAPTFRRSFWEVQELREGFVEIFQLNLAELTTEVDLFLSEAMWEWKELMS